MYKTAMALGGLALLGAVQVQAAKPTNPVCSITSASFPNPADDATADPACDAQVCVYVGGTVEYVGQVSSGTPPYTVNWTFGGGTPSEAADTIADSGGTSTQQALYDVAGSYTTTLDARDSSGKHGRTCSDARSVRVISAGGGGGGQVSINSTSANGGPAASPVPEQPLASVPGFTVIGINDLGMHCADLDSRVLAILPPFNVVHAVAIKKGTGDTDQTLPHILTDADVEVVYSAAHNDKDPVFDGSPTRITSIAGDGTVYKTNFWDLNPLRNTGNILGFDLYDPFYPDGVLDFYNTPSSVDTGLPVPDPAQLPSLAADQQDMPGKGAPYAANDPQTFKRFDTVLPFFATFPFGYTQTGLNWFAADGIPLTPYDDEGRENAYPLMRIQAKAAAGNSLGVAAGTTLATVDTVLPISIESDCKACHTSSVDGGNGEAACIPTFDSNCPVEGSRRSGTPFTVATVSDDPDANSTQLQSEEFAADLNIVRLHDAKHGTNLEANVPVSCQTCHYSPALDLAQVGPSNDNGKDQVNHKSMSNVMHSYHGQFTDLFPLMPAPSGNNQSDRLAVLDQTCYKCHPGKRTQCLRGAMFQGGVLCQDCHGNMADVGEDFSRNVSPSNPGAFEVSGDFYTNPNTPRVPWANEPMCQACHTGDAVNNLAGDPDVIPASDGIRLLRAYRVDANGDPKELNARPIVASNRRFAENQVTDANGTKEVLYRLSKGHGDVFCEACHGSTHAVWPVTPRSGPFVANDNTTATQLQGHDGKIQECDVCHERDANGDLTMPLGLDGPHGLHPVNDSRWNLNHRNFTGNNYANCRTCHGQDLKGSPLSKTAADRVVICKNDRGTLGADCADDGHATIPAGTEVTCGMCHRQKK